MTVDFRELRADEDDEALLRELSTFAEPGDTHAFEGWANGPPSDYGQLAYDPETSAVIGAAWYRGETYLDPFLGRRHGHFGSREVFVSVHPEFRQQQVATVLLERVGRHALEEDRTVEAFIVLPANEVSEKLCRKHGLEQVQPGKWMLDLTESRRSSGPHGPAGG